MFMVCTQREVPGENGIRLRQCFALKHGMYLGTLQAKLGSHGRISSIAVSSNVLLSLDASFPLLR